MDEETRMDENTIRENLKRAREERGITQAHLADSIDISVTAYQKIENGKTRILNPNFSKCAETLGISLSELVNGFKPVRDAHATIEDVKESYGLRMRAQEKGYLSELHLKDLEIEHLKETIRQMEETITALKMLNKQYTSQKQE